MPYDSTNKAPRASIGPARTLSREPRPRVSGRVSGGKNTALPNQRAGGAATNPTSKRGNSTTVQAPRNPYSASRARPGVASPAKGGGSPGGLRPTGTGRVDYSSGNRAKAGVGSKQPAAGAGSAQHPLVGTMGSGITHGCACGKHGCGGGHGCAGRKYTGNPHAHGMSNCQ